MISTVKSILPFRTVMVLRQSYVKLFLSNSYICNKMSLISSEYRWYSS